MLKWFFVGLALLLALPSLAGAQETLPVTYRLNIPDGDHQMWNNCGPATITNGLKFFGYTDHQRRAAAYLKPNELDKNVSPWQLADYVNTQVPELPVYSLVRAGGTLTLLKTLVANNFPVIIESGYDPEPTRLGWMGHYLLIIGYDDNGQTFMTHDSYLGPNTKYNYDEIDKYWRHFNRTYVVLYHNTDEETLLALLGADADEWQNHINALEAARAEAVQNQTDPFAWFNMGTNFVALGMYAEAAVAYDQARNVGGGLPWRMLWYQFGPYEAYLKVDRPNDVIALARSAIENGVSANESLFQVEETYYYAGLARELKGEYTNALTNFNTALQLNPNFTPAKEARDRLQSQLNSG